MPHRCSSGWNNQGRPHLEFKTHAVNCESIAIAELRRIQSAQLTAGRERVAQIHGPGSTEVEPQPKIRSTREVAEIDASLTPAGSVIEGLDDVRERLSNRGGGQSPVRAIVELIESGSGLETVVGADKIPSSRFIAHKDPERIPHQSRCVRIRIPVGILRFKEVVEVQDGLIALVVPCQIERIADH